MELRNGDVLLHTIYDPVKAHAYYIRTRQLKGRKASSKALASNPSAKIKSPTYTVNYGDKQVKLTGRELAEQRAYAAKRISSIKENLAELTVKFKKLLAEARKSETKTKREAKKDPTASEKSKAARESKKYQEKHKQEISTKRKTESKKKSAKPESKTDAVVALELKINDVKNRLTAVVARQRALAGATRNR